MPYQCGLAGSELGHELPNRIKPCLNDAEPANPVYLNQQLQPAHQHSLAPKPHTVAPH